MTSELLARGWQDGAGLAGAVGEELEEEEGQGGRGAQRHTAQCQHFGCPPPSLPCVRVHKSQVASQVTGHLKSLSAQADHLQNDNHHSSLNLKLSMEAVSCLCLEHHQEPVPAECLPCALACPSESTPAAGK
eukprot:563142-Rhodomonas_salina.1